MHGFQVSTDTSVTSNDAPAGYVAYSDFTAEPVARRRGSGGVLVAAWLMMIVGTFIPYNDGAGQTERLITSASGFHLALIPGISLLLTLIAGLRNSTGLRSYALGGALVPMSMGLLTWIASAFYSGLSPIAVVREFGVGSYLVGLGGLVALVPLLSLIRSVSRANRSTERVSRRHRQALMSCVVVVTVCQLVWARWLLAAPWTATLAVAATMLLPHGAALYGSWTRSRGDAAMVAGVLSVFAGISLARRFVFHIRSDGWGLDRVLALTSFGCAVLGIVVVASVCRRSERPGTDVYSL